jgi:hypothetical protein
MGLFSRLKEMKAKRQQKLEERQVSSYTNAQSRIKELETRKSMLKERESVFLAKQKLEEDIKEREISVKRMESRERNPVFSSIKDNIKAKLKEAEKRKATPLKDNNPWRNPSFGGINTGNSKGYGFKKIKGL